MNSSPPPTTNLHLNSVSTESQSGASQNVWYLGIDFGTTGLSAVLLNASTGDRYPIYWESVPGEGATKSSFRLPAIAYSDSVPTTPEPTKALPVLKIIPPGLDAPYKAFTKRGIFLKKFKPYLKIGTPYYFFDQNNWEPVLEWSEQQLVPLYWVNKALQALLLTMTPVKVYREALLKQEYPLAAVASLTAESFSIALSQLKGVILGCPAQWEDTYRFNLREAVLAAHLVKHPEQIFFIEDAIATLLAGILTSTDVNRLGSESPPLFTLKPGNTLVINAGATTTELAIVNLPDDISQVTFSDFHLRSFPYAGNAIDQDIICQLLIKREDFAASLLPFNLSQLPSPGEPDLETRYHFQQMLHASRLGQALLEAASYLKLILQHQEEYQLNVGNHRWVVRRLDLERRVLLPFVYRLSQELNGLLLQAGLSEHAISQVICTGGTTAISKMREWLQQKLPNATLIHDARLTNSSPFNSSLKVALGLAILPLYPQVLDRSQHQYSDSFLLMELLRCFPNKTLSVPEIMQLLEHRGINTRICYHRIMALLEGQLPLGIMLSTPDASWLTPQSREILVAQINGQSQTKGVNAANPLFFKEENQLYRPNFEQFNRLRSYLNNVLAGTYQKLEEPLFIDLDVPIATEK